MGSGLAMTHFDPDLLKQLNVRPEPKNKLTKCYTGSIK